MNRRNFIRVISLLSAGACAAPLVHLSAREQIDFFFTRLSYESGNWEVDERMPANVLNSLIEYTSLRVDIKERIVALSDPQMLSAPFCYLAGHRLVQFNAEEKQNFQRYVENGGFVFVDDCNHDIDGVFARSFERQMSEAVQLFYRGLGWGNAEVGVLAQALRVAQALELLNLDGNAIGDAGAAALASALHEGTAPALKTIKLKGNPVASSPLSLEALTRAREGLEVEAGARSEGARGPMAEAAPHPAPRSPVSGQGGLACCLRCVRKSPQMQRLD